MRMNVDPAFRTVAPCRSTTAANLPAGDAIEPPSTTDGTWRSSDAAIMYDWPVIQPVVATTHITSPPGARPRTRLLVAHNPTW